MVGVVIETNYFSLSNLQGGKNGYGVENIGKSYLDGVLELACRYGEAVEHMILTHGIQPLTLWRESGA